MLRFDDIADFTYLTLTGSPDLYQTLSVDLVAEHGQVSRYQLFTVDWNTMEASYELHSDV